MKKMKKLKVNIKFKKRYLLIVAVVLLLIVIGVNAAGPENTAVSVEVSAAETGAVQSLLDLSGTVEPGEEKTYFAPVSAQVSKVPYEAGDVVEAGDVLVEFDSDDLDTQYKTAELTNAASEYGFRDAVSQSGKSASDLAQARSDKASLETKVKNKKAEVSSLQDKVRSEAASASQQQNSQLTKIQKEKTKLNDEMLELSKKAIDLTTDISKKSDELSRAVAEGKNTDKLQTQLNNLNTEYNNNQKRQLEINTRLTEISLEESGLSMIDSSDTEMKLANAQSELAELQADLAMAESEISMAEAGIMTENALGQLEATSNIEELTAMTTMELIGKAREGMVAEFGGVITSVSVTEGTTSMQAGELITVASNEHVKVRVSLTKYDLEEIETGQSADITIAGKEYKGKVTKIDKIATINDEGNIVIGAEITLNNPDKDIFLGVEASVSIAGDKVSNAVLIPSSAVNVDTEGQFCYIVEDSIVKRQTITTGISSGSQIQVIEGIKAGDEVVTATKDDIESGTEVIISQSEDE